jgi:DNA polymerase-3 subunit gamma/tau
MAYTVLARKYRPQTFSDLVGQEHVSRTIGNAIATGRVAHAFLFTGARGVGKTTTARLLAKSLNCEKGPTAEPCNVCDQCTQIAAGTDMDVLEIDGASNNSVDDVRRLQESLPYRPVRDRFKVVIVDEVHMLSTGAFNAFLKTLEEPPPHVKFIFATTEAHKVPVTIRSRCQRHDFRLISRATVAARVREILSREGIEADDDAVAIVSREAAGSMRDALTVLDQLLAFGGGKLVGSEVAAGLGVADRKHVQGVADAVLSGDAAGCLRAVAALANQGIDILHFAKQLLSLTRDLIVLRVVGADDHELVDLAEDERASMSALAASHPPAHIERTFSGLSLLVEEIGQSTTPELVLEMGLVRLAERPPLEPLTELLARLAALEAKLAGGGGPSSPRPGPGQPPGGGGGSGPSGPRPSAPPVRRMDPAPAPRLAKAPAPSAVPTVSSPAPGPMASSAAAAVAVAPAPAPRTLTPVPAPAPVTTSAPASVPPTPAATAPQAATAPATASAAIPEAWMRMVEQLHDSQPALCAVLEHGTPTHVSADRIVVTFPEGSFFGKQAAAAPAKDALATIAERVLGQRPKIEIAEGKIDGATTMAAEQARRREEDKKLRDETARNHPAVREAMSVFDATDSDVRVEDI